LWMHVRSGSAQVRGKPRDFAALGEIQFATRPLPSSSPLLGVSRPSFEVRVLSFLLARGRCQAQSGSGNRPPRPEGACGRVATPDTGRDEAWKALPVVGCKTRKVFSYLNVEKHVFLISTLREQLILVFFVVSSSLVFLSRNDAGGPSLPSFLRPAPPLSPQDPCGMGKVRGRGLSQQRFSY